MTSQRRPQLMGRGARAVLIFPRAAAAQHVALDALERISELRYQVVALVDPSDYLAAHQMVMDGLADLILVTSPHHLPSVRLLYLDGDRHRTQPLPRPQVIQNESPEPVDDYVPPDRQRPRLLRHEDAPIRRTQRIPRERSA